MKKDTIYIDIEDEITDIIEKVKSSKSKIIALVPPKRSNVLQSAVNMKLLARSAEEAGKKIVLVTNETPLLNLAGGLGVPVAKNLHSKPYIPKPQSIKKDEIESIIDGKSEDLSTPIGELAKDNDLPSAEPDQTNIIDSDKTKEPKANAKRSSKKRKYSALKVPNFNKFRNKLLLGVGLTTIIFGVWFWAFKVVPRATITVEAQTSRIDTVIEFTADATVKESDYEKNIFAAQKAVIKREVTESFTPTGEINAGTKASGIVTVTNYCFNPGTINAGTKFIASNGLEFVSTEDVVVPNAVPLSGNCSGQETQVDVPVGAVAPGDEYNLAPTSYTVNGYSSDEVSGFGGQMSGGTDKFVKAVTQEDVENVTQKLKNKKHDEVIEELRAKFGEDIVPINETFVVTEGEVKVDPPVGSEAETAVASMPVTFSMLGISREILTKVLDDYQQARLEGGNQAIYDNGIDNLSFSLINKINADKMELRLRTSGYIGPQFDLESLAKEISGKKYSEVINTIKSLPGVRDVKVEFSHPWVFRAPEPDKIDIILNVDSTAQ